MLYLAGEAMTKTEGLLDQNALKTPEALRQFLTSQNCILKTTQQCLESPLRLAACLFPLKERESCLLNVFNKWFERQQKLNNKVPRLPHIVFLASPGDFIAYFDKDCNVCSIPSLCLSGLHVQGWESLE